jgi:hypothetical protein
MLDTVHSRLIFVLDDSERHRFSGRGYMGKWETLAYYSDDNFAPYCADLHGLNFLLDEKHGGIDLPQQVVSVKS